MQQEPYSPEHHRQRSEFIRALVQSSFDEHPNTRRNRHSTPKSIIQYWHDLEHLPRDVGECMSSWVQWDSRGFTYRVFDERSARDFIRASLGAEYELAFDRCYHPAMQSDYFRLCYLLLNGGFYVDADDVCLSDNIGWLFEDGRLRLQPLCYDITSGQMVEPTAFLHSGAYNPNWIFYFNNNPLFARPQHPIIDLALRNATALLVSSSQAALPEIQATTGPGLLSVLIFQLGMSSPEELGDCLAVLRSWDAIAVSRWPLGYRNDARNWRFSNQVKFDKAKL